MGNTGRGFRVYLAAASLLGGMQSHAGIVFGTVADTPSFLPLEGAWVYLDGKRPGTDSMRTDSAGAYRFSDIADCGMGCEVRVRMPGYWPFASRTFALAPEQNLELDIQLDMIHSLTVQVVKAEDPSQPLSDAQAVISAAEYESPRCLAADSAGKLDFRDLHTFTAYLLTASAPGRKTTSNGLHFHGPPAHGSWKVELGIDSAHSGKTVRGTLSAKDKGPFPGARALLSCRNGGIAADLFAEAGTDGKFAIDGVPADCDSALLLSGSDTLAIGLPGPETLVDWELDVPRTTPLRSAGARPRYRADRTRSYDLNGRKLGARRGPFRAAARRVSSR